MWRYLREFLSDPRVIELPQGDLVSDPLRPGADHAAAEIRRQLRQDLEPREGRVAAAHLSPARRPKSWPRRSRDLPDVVVDWACATATRRPQASSSGWSTQGCDRILSFPLYPQYSATTTATANDQLFRALMKMRRAPAVRTVPPYYDEPVYIDALARSIERHLATLDFEPEVVLASYHGIPKPYFEQGRSLSLPLPEDDAAAARKARLGRQEADHHLPVALRRAGMAAALYRQDRREAGQGRREVDRHRQSRLFGRLHRDAGGDRPARRPRSSITPAARNSPTSPASTTAPRAWR